MSAQPDGDEGTTCYALGSCEGCPLHMICVFDPANGDGEEYVRGWDAGAAMAGNREARYKPPRPGVSAGFFAGYSFVRSFIARWGKM